jgi:hypothetical protein
MDKYKEDEEFFASQPEEPEMTPEEEKEFQENMARLKRFADQSAKYGKYTFAQIYEMLETVDALTGMTPDRWSVIVDAAQKYAKHLSQQCDKKHPHGSCQGCCADSAASMKIEWALTGKRWDDQDESEDDLSRDDINESISEQGNGDRSESI